MYQLWFTKFIPTLIAGYDPARIISSNKAFLFSLKPFNSLPKKLTVLSEKTYQAIRSDKFRGPCWGEEKDELCFNDQLVKTEIHSGGVFDVSGISDTSTYFMGGSSLQADDVEVFTITGKANHYNGITGDSAFFIEVY